VKERVWSWEKGARETWPSERVTGDGTDFEVEGGEAIVEESGYLCKRGAVNLVADLEAAERKVERLRIRPEIVEVSAGNGKGVDRRPIELLLRDDASAEKIVGHAQAFRIFTRGRSDDSAEMRDGEEEPAEKATRLRRLLHVADVDLLYARRKLRIVFEVLDEPSQPSHWLSLLVLLLLLHLRLEHDSTVQHRRRCTRPIFADGAQR
jgi:hypothetical protein